MNDVIEDRRQGGRMLAKCNCKKKCSELLTETDRKDINERFSQLNYSDRRHFIDRHVQRMDCARKTVRSTLKKNTYKYTLSVNSVSIGVCKIMFLHTIGKKTDAIITEFFKAKLR